MIRFSRRGRDEVGFTLIELMVVVLIIGVLISIALPTFLGARQRAEIRSTQSNLRNGITAAKTYYATRGTYVGFTRIVAEGIEPPLNWQSAGTPAVGQVRIGANAGSAPTLTTVMLVARAGTTPARYLCIKDVATGTAATAGTFYRMNTALANVNTFARCSFASW